ncbi:hypothetical protein D7030_01650 [Flavobacteriaceae bacterium AU392]|nr:hypothetical protein D1817_08125 [Flavobacteriaceae bacterium]RKM85400.1 hypothetical protein D7030_01650 [Flavobacteriaceae bacterium AU392]
MENNNNDPSIPSGVISREKAIELNNEWTKTRAEAMNQCISDVTGGKVTKDSRSSWWSIEDLEAYIKYAKKQDKDVSGLRIYCGAYSDDNCYSTSFIVPTATVKGSLGKDVGDDEEEEMDLPIPPLNRGTTKIPPEDGYEG